MGEIVKFRADPDQPCGHEDFDVIANVGRLTDNGQPDGELQAVFAELTFTCQNCGERFRTNGVEAGMSPARPMCSIDGYTLIVPLHPETADDDFGLGIPGYTIRQVMAD